MTFRLTASAILHRSYFIVHSGSSGPGRRPGVAPGIVFPFDS
jgi:hypothetical protein